MSDLEMRMWQMLLAGFGIGVTVASMVWQREVNPRSIASSAD